MTRRRAIETALSRLAPRIPAHEYGAIVDHGMDSAGLKTAMPETAAWLSMIAYIRHALTDYDALLDDGYDRDSARYFVLADINAILRDWGVRREISSDE